MISGFLESSTFQIQHVQSPLSHSLMLDIQKSKILRLMLPQKEKPNHCSHQRLTATEQFGLIIIFRFDILNNYIKMKALVLHERRKIPQIAGIILMDKVRLISSLEIKKGKYCLFFGDVESKDLHFKKAIIVEYSYSISSDLKRHLRNILYY